MDTEIYSVDWKTFPDHLQTVVGELFESNFLTDVTLVCDDNKKLNAHKIILCASSYVFKTIISELHENCSVIYLRGIKHQEMEAILKFMYFGTATFGKDRVDEFLKVALSLEVKELSSIKVTAKVADKELEESEIHNDEIDVDENDDECDKETDTISQDKSVGDNESLDEENSLEVENDYDNENIESIYINKDKSGIGLDSRSKYCEAKTAGVGVIKLVPNRQTKTKGLCANESLTDETDVATSM